MFKITRINVWLYGILNNYIFKYYDLLLNPIVRNQLKKPTEIPIIIINFNQLFYLKKLIDFLLDKNFENIVIIDNNSSYPPLLEYYDLIKTKVTVEIMPQNYGHMVFFENKDLKEKYGRGFYVVTDADILPNNNLPEDFMKHMISHLIKNWSIVTKTGFSLVIDDIPDENVLKEKVLTWESEFWKHKVKENVFEASIDTTFAIYKPNYPTRYDNIHFFIAHRFAGNYIARHGGWYIDQQNLTTEQEYYACTASASSSWLQNEKNIIN